MLTLDNNTIRFVQTTSQKKPGRPLKRLPIGLIRYGSTSGPAPR
jgi:hypothetical protein